MTGRSRIITASAVTALAAGAATGYAATAPRDVTADGVGRVEVGQTFKRLRAAELIGRLRPGCEFGGPDTRSARLKPPLKGHVNFTRTRPRRITDITIRGGARARGIGIGATIPRIRAKFPKARVDHRTEDVLGITLVRIPRGGGGRIKFAVDVDTRRVVLIGVPVIAFCE